MISLRILSHHRIKTCALLFAGKYASAYISAVEVLAHMYRHVMVPCPFSKWDRVYCCVFIEYKLNKIPGGGYVSVGEGNEMYV